MEGGSRTPHRRAAPSCVASGDRSSGWEFSLGQSESEILVDSQEEVSSEKTEQYTSRISQKGLGWGESWRRLGRSKSWGSLSDGHLERWLRSSRLALGDATFSGQERRRWRRGSLEREVVWKWKNPRWRG